MSVQVTTATGESATGERSAAREVSASVRRRLEPMPGWDWRSWVVAAWVVAIAAILRFVKLGFPPSLVFDEVYYANEGQELLDHGVEWRYETDSAGATTADRVDFVVHPPLGKWLIGIGIAVARNVFDDAPVVNGISSGAFGWRLAPAVFGVLSVLILTRTARRMFRSTVLGATAGLLMALDGMHFVLSRTAILDIFVMFFVLAAFACLVLDRDQRRARWLREMENGLDPTAAGSAGRPQFRRRLRSGTSQQFRRRLRSGTSQQSRRRLRSGTSQQSWRRSPSGTGSRFEWSAVPWWRLGAGVMLGLGCGVKWSVIFFVPIFAALVYLWEVGLRKTVGAPHPWRDALLDEGGWVIAMGVLVVPTYLATWAAWFAGDNGWKRHWLEQQGKEEPFLLGALSNLWSYHVDILNWHTQLTTPHAYQSEPWQWLILGRPVLFYTNGDPVCGAEQCVAQILLLGTPVLWWSFIPALVAMAWFGISRRDWRALAIGAGVAGGLLPWFYYSIADNRTMYYFYAIPAQPFLVLAVTYVLGCLITGPGVGRFGTGRVRLGLALPAEDRRLYGTIAAAAFVVLVAICFWIYYPLYVGDSIPYEDWWRRMLLGSRWV